MSDWSNLEASIIKAATIGIALIFAGAEYKMYMGQFEGPVNSAYNKISNAVKSEYRGFLGLKQNVQIAYQMAKLDASNISRTLKG